MPMALLLPTARPVAVHSSNSHHSGLIPRLQTCHGRPIASVRSQRRFIGGSGIGGGALQRLPPPCAEGDRSSLNDRQQRKDDQQIVLGVGIGLTLLVALALKLGGGAFLDADAWDLGAFDGSFTPVDAAGGLLWATSLWFCSPWQQLLIFWGQIEMERPSDWVLQKMGRAAGLKVDAIDYVVPGPLQAAALALFGASGMAVSASLQALLGDSIWAVSTGMGAALASGMYEVARPRRLSVDEALEKEKQWQEFSRFADQRLERRGRCHETEVVRALQRDIPKYRSGEAASSLDSSLLRDLVRNWAPNAERSSNGFYKNLGLKAANSSSSSSGSMGSSSSIGSSSSSSIGSIDGESRAP